MVLNRPQRQTSGALNWIQLAQTPFCLHLTTTWLQLCCDQTGSVWALATGKLMDVTVYVCVTSKNVNCFRVNTPPTHTHHEHQHQTKPLHSQSHHTTNTTNTTRRNATATQRQRNGNATAIRARMHGPRPVSCLAKSRHHVKCYKFFLCKRCATLNADGLCLQNEMLKCI